MEVIIFQRQLSCSIENSGERWPFNLQRSSTAADRREILTILCVATVLDALPDVDLDAGHKLTRAEIHGTFELENIVFSYQMRLKVAKLMDFLLRLMNLVL